MNNRKSGGTGLAILLTVGIMLFIGFCINSNKPKRKKQIYMMLLCYQVIQCQILH